MTDPKVTPLPNLREIEREAAVWAVRLDSSDVPTCVLAEFEQWRGQSPQHRETADRFGDFWAGMADLDAFNDLAETEAVSEPRRLDAAARERPFRRRVVTWSIAASVAAVCGLVAYQVVFVTDSSFRGGYETALGEQETVDLPDGSRVVLNTDSAFEASFSGSTRIIKLTRGEAFFDVEPDPSRPFTVETDKGSVTAVGTAFSVRVNDRDMGVLVTEGKVALRAPAAARGNGRDSQHDNEAKSASEVVEVEAGHGAVFGGESKKVDAIAPKDMDRQLDWQDGLLAFHGEPLKDVVADIARYTNVTIEIADPELAERRVVAYYQVGKIEPMLEALKLTANVRVERIDSRHVRLSESR